MSKAFRSRDPIKYEGTVPFIRDLDRMEIERNGTIVSSEALVIVSPEDYHKKHPVPTQEFSLTDELEAGVPLREIPCSKMLDSADNLDYAVNDTAEQTIFDQLSKEQINE